MYFEITVVFCDLEICYTVCIEARACGLSKTLPKVAVNTSSIHSPRIIPFSSRRERHREKTRQGIFAHRIERADMQLVRAPTNMGNIKASSNGKKSDQDKQKNILDDFPNPHFANAMKLYQEENERAREGEGEKARQARERAEKLQEDLRARQKEMRRREAECEAMTAEEKKRIDDERWAKRQANDEQIYGWLLEEIGEVDDQTVEALHVIGERCWRTDAPPRHRGSRDDRTWISPNLLSSNISHSIPWDGPLHDEGLLRAIAAKIEGIAIAKHPRPALLWLYNTDSPHVTDAEDGFDRTYIRLSPEEISDAARDGDESFLSALDYLAGTYGIIYDERQGDGYDYDTEDVVETIESTGHKVTHHLFRLRNMSLREIVPDEIVFLEGTLNVSFIVDGYSAFYHEPMMKGVALREESGLIHPIYEEQEERIEKLKAKGSAYWRLYWNSGFEKLLAMTCLDQEDREHLRDIMENTQGRFQVPWRLAHALMGIPDEAKSEQMTRIVNIMQDAVVAWDHIQGSPGGMYELLDEQPSDDEIFTHMDEWMRESKTRDMVLQAQEEGTDIWERLRERRELDSWNAISE